jgi:hypothetical protein
MDRAVLVTYAQIHPHKSITFAGWRSLLSSVSGHQCVGISSGHGHVPLKPTVTSLPKWHGGKTECLG